MDYVIYATDGGAPLEGASPTIDVYVKVSDGSSAGAAPVVSELSGGFYKFTAVPTFAIAVRVDMNDPTLADRDRYISMQITPEDAYLDTAISGVKSQTDQLTFTATNVNATLDASTKGSIADYVWDEIITGATHNIPTSAGRRLRTITDDVIINGFVLGSTVNTITFNGDASSDDGAYDPAIITIINGRGAGQCRLILEYKGSTKTATVDRNWKTLPDITSEYIIISDPGREHVNEGLARGGTANTITLNALASANDNAYRGQVVFLRAGTGEDQACRVIAYDGTTKLATVAHDWSVIPDTTTSYVMLPTAVLEKTYLATGVWDEATSLHVGAGTTGEAVSEIPGISATVTTIESDVLALRTQMSTLINIETGKWEIVNNQMIFYDTSGAVLMTFDLFDENGNPTMRHVFSRVPV
jgi:hypothetical protein